MTMTEEVEQLKLRFENLSGLVPESHPCRIALQGWFRALIAQAQLLLIVFDLQSLIEAKDGSDGADQDLTLLTLAQLREAATAAEDLALSDGSGL